MALVEQPLLARQQVRAPEQHGELGELGGLHLERPDGEPALRAVDGDADAGHEHGDEQHDADQQRRVRQQAVPAAAAASRARTPAAQRDEDRLLGERSSAAAAVLVATRRIDAESTMTMPKPSSSAGAPATRCTEVSGRSR